ncbi:MAG: hypothetical protein M3319_05150 [Actinomycetota bacterium]|nr:hypothetical protein [Actinomycetota bacterium]
MVLAHSRIGDPGGVPLRRPPWARLARHSQEVTRGGGNLLRALGRDVVQGADRGGQ